MKNTNSGSGKKSFKEAIAAKADIIKNILFFFVTAVILAAVIYAFLFVIARFDVFPISENLKSMILFFEKKEPPSTEVDKMYGILRQTEESGENYEQADMSPNILAYLESLKEPDVFFRESTVTYHYENEEKTFTHRIYKNGDNARIETEADGYSRTVIHSNGDTYVRYPSTGEEIIYKNDESFSYHGETGISSVDDFFSDESNKMDEIVSFTRSASGSSMNITFSSSENIKHRYEISLHNSIVSTAYIYSSDKPATTLKTLQFVIDSDMAEGLFTIPYRDGTQK